MHPPRTKRDWRSFSGFAAFIVALFAEMYGFPLTIYLLSGWLLNRYPNLDLLSHNAGHLWSTVLRLPDDPHFSIFHILSYAFIGGGFILISLAWNVLYQAQQTNQVATTGPYARIRHPQYVGFVLIMFGFLLQWPTLVTLIMFPILVAVYMWLARQEEKESVAAFSEDYVHYMATTSSFIPHLIAPISAGSRSRRY